MYYSKKLQIKVFLHRTSDISPRGHKSISPPLGVELRASKDDMVEKSECIFPFLYNLIFKPYRLSSPLAPLRGWGGVWKKLQIKLFWHRILDKKVREGICLSPARVELGALERYGLNIKSYRNGKLYSLLGWMLSKIRIVPKKGSNKSFSASISDKEVLEGICLSPPPPSEWSYGARKMKWFKY